jgi:hypothetical protein
MRAEVAQMVEANEKNEERRASILTEINALASNVPLNSLDTKTRDKFNDKF